MAPFVADRASVKVGVYKLVKIFGARKLLAVLFDGLPYR